MFFSFLVIFSFISCSDDNSNNSASPKLVFSSDTLTFQGEEYKSLYIAIDGADECAYEIVSYPDWVDVYPLSGVLTRDIQSIDIKSKSEPNKPGLYNGKLLVFSSFGTDTIYLKRFVGGCLLYTLPDTINVSMFAASRNFSIKNEGNVDIDYNIAVSSDLISLSSNQGTISPNKEENLTLNINRDLLETGAYEAQIFVDINNIKDTVNVKIDNFKEKKIILKSDIVDAEFSKITNKIVYVSSDPLSLVIYDVTTKKSESVTLNYLPTCVSISSDGNYAVVGHDGKITYVNLTNKSIISTIDVSCIAYDIVLANNKWAYVTPQRDQWVSMHSIDLENKIEYSGSSIYAGTKIKMHPSGKYLYSIDNQTSPGDIDKFDIQNGEATYLYDSPYHGDYPITGDFNFSEDGKRIFVYTGTVLKTSEVQSQDLLYNGTIQDANYMEGIAHSSKKNNIYTISRTGQYYWDSTINYFVYIYNAENLLFKKKIELEKYIVKNNESGKSYNAVPHFIFTNTAGNKVYVLADSPESGLLYNWSLQELDIE